MGLRGLAGPGARDGWSASVRTHLHITHHRRVTQGEDGIVPGGDELVGDEVVVTDFEDGLHDGGVVDLLMLVELAAAWISCGVDVADVVLVNAQAANDIAVHDADVVDVEEQLEVRAADVLDEIDAEVHVVAKVAGMAFHRVGAVTRIQVLEDQGDALFLGERQHLFPGGEAGVDGLVTVHAVELHAGEGDDLFAADICGDVDGFGELGDDFVMKLGIARSLGKAVAADEGDVEPELFHIRVELGVDAFDADEADVLRMPGEFEHVHRLPAPAHECVANAFVFDDVGGVRSGFGDGLGAEAGGGSRGECGGEEMATVHGWRFRFQVQSFKLGRGRERGVRSLSYAEGGEDEVMHSGKMDGRKRGKK